MLLVLGEPVRNSSRGDQIAVEVREILRQFLVVGNRLLVKLLLLDLALVLFYHQFNRSVILFKIKETTILLAYHLVILVLQGPVFIIIRLGKHVRAAHVH